MKRTLKERGGPSAAAAGVTGSSALFGQRCCRLAAKPPLDRQSTGTQRTPEAAPLSAQRQLDACGWRLSGRVASVCKVSARVCIPAAAPPPCPAFHLCEARDHSSPPATRSTGVCLGGARSRRGCCAVLRRWCRFGCGSVVHWVFGSSTLPCTCGRGHENHAGGKAGRMFGCNGRFWRSIACVVRSETSPSRAWTKRGDSVHACLASAPTPPRHPSRTINRGRCVIRS